VPIGFAKCSIDLNEKKWKDVERFNATLETLISRRKSEIAVTGPFVHSKTAWKWPAPGLDDTQLSESSSALELHRA
jgi:hypothetical protein